jgi:hypothetical protein
MKVQLQPAPGACHFMGPVTLQHSLIGQHNGWVLNFQFTSVKRDHS